MCKNCIYRAALAAFCFAASVAGYHAMIFERLPAVFRVPEEDMDYAWFVPLFSIAVLWSERKRIAAAAGAPSFGGVLFALPFFALGLLGARGLQVRFELLGFAGLLVAIPWAFFGRAAAARFVFPAACLLFCMPMASYLSIFTVRLRLFASAVSGGFLSVLFDDAVREGNLITLAGTLLDGKPFTIDIADPCSGLRSVFALVAISVGYGYWTQPTWARRALLAASAIPIAIAGNIVRIVSIAVVAKASSAQFAIGYYHDFSGYVVFAVAIGLLLCAGTLIDRLFRARSAPGPAPAGAGTVSAGAPRPRAAGFAACAAMTALTVAAMSFQLFAPAPEVCGPAGVVFPEIAGFSAEALEPSVAETNLLKGAVVEKRLYKAASGFWFQATSVTSGPDKSSLHRPELCLPSQGFDISGRRAAEAGGVPWRVISLAGRAGSGDALFAYTFFNQDLWRTSSHEARIWRDVWDRTANGRIDRWTMVTVFFPSGDARAFASLLEHLGGFAK